MKTKMFVLAGVIIATGCVVAGFMASKPVTPPVIEAKPNLAPSPAARPLPATLSPSKENAADTAVVPAEIKKSSLSMAPADAPVMNNGYEVQDPMARIALHFVGADAEATAYWLGAINDSSMPPEERKDLIEDLNETGLADPDHPTAADLPLITNRLRLIEQIGLNPLDDVNRDALAEAYKDLLDLASGKGPN